MLSNEARGLLRGAARVLLWPAYTPFPLRARKWYRDALPPLHERSATCSCQRNADALERSPRTEDALRILSLPLRATPPVIPRCRNAEALKAFAAEHKQAIEEFVAVQFLFDRQWKAIRVSGCLLIPARLFRTVGLHGPRGSVSEFEFGQAD